MTARIALDSGSTMRTRNCRSLQPSIWLASSISTGMLFCMKVRVMIMLYTEIAPGTISAHIVLSIPSERTIR